ncbi:MAG: serine/threonine-protein kinase [Gemmatimonadota bacterium]
MSYFAPGSRVGDRYEIGRELGRGGHSVVYRAKDLSLGTDVAVKLLVPSPATQELARERLKREVLAVRRLAHPNIVPVYDYLSDGPWQFIIMQLVQGEDLEQRITRRGPLPAEAAALLGRSIASALTLAHREGILHRDVKPRNILLDQAGTALLTDFGSARILSQGTMTEPGGLVGTLAYAAPELLTGERADARSDVYALGLTLYFALAGRLPPQDSAHLPPTPSDDGFSPRAANLSVPAWLDEAIARATMADPADRFPTAACLMDALGAPIAAAAPIATSTDRCLVCGDIDVEGLTLCGRCGTLRQPSDALIFLEPARPRERDTRQAQLLGLFGGSSSAGRREVALGLKPLARVPTGMADAAVDRLASRGLAAQAVPVGAVWRMIPFGLWAVAGLALGLGFWAGREVHPALWWTSGAFVALLLAGAANAGRQPLIDRKPRRPRLAPELERQVLETAAELPIGAARTLFGGVVRLVRHLAEDAGDGQSELMAEVIPAVCLGARELAQLDAALLLFEREPPPVDAAESRGTVEQRRDRLVQCLLDTQAGLLRLAALPLGGESAESELREVVRALGYQAEGRAAVEEVLLGR